MSDAVITAPNGCAVCGELARNHGWRNHGRYVAPRDDLRKARMLANREGR